MTITKKRRDPHHPLRQFIQLVEIKCHELPRDIDHWIAMAAKHEVASKTHQNIIQSSVKPREVYLTTLQKLHGALLDAMQILEGAGHVPDTDVSPDLPVETIIRKYLQATTHLQDISKNSQSVHVFFNGLLERILFIRNDLNQTILRCSAGEINYKNIEHQLRVLEPAFDESFKAHIEVRKSRLTDLTEALLQKVEMDVSVRQSIQDRHVMHSTLQMYLNHIESNPEFNELMPTLQYKIRKIVSRPLDAMLSKQQQEVDVATYELQQLLEPVQGKMTVKVPNSATSVHQLIQQALAQQDEMTRLKVNVMGAFKHLVNQVDQLFQFKPFTPVQSASVLGVAWMQHPLTSAENIRDFQKELGSITQSESYQKLMQSFGSQNIDESFRFVDKKMNEMADQLEINERVQAMNQFNSSPVLVDATSFCIQATPQDPLKVRREIIHRAGYLMGIKTYIQELCDSVRAHLFLVYYEHSLSPETINLTSKINKIMNQVSTEFYDRKNTDEAIDRNVFMASVRQVFEEICDTELEKNMAIFTHRQRIKVLVQTLKETNKYSRKDIRKKIIAEKNELKELLIDTNIPRLKEFIHVLSKSTYETIHHDSVYQLDGLKKKLKTLIQQKVALEQVVVL